MSGQLPIVRAVFLSYASQDAAAVQRIAESLRAAGVEVWFDRNELVGGDAWDRKIRTQIRECALFVPVISANTQARGEGYFRLEWKLAVDRSHLMAPDQPFLLPIVIDDTPDAAARVADEFRAVQWTRLPGGETTPAFCARVKKLLGGEGGDVSPRRPSRNSEGNPGRLGETSPPSKPSSRPWLVPTIVGVAAVALALWQPWRAKEKPASPALPAAVAAPAAPISEARKLVAQARALFDDGDEANHENFFLADDLLKKAQALDSTDGEIWAAEAELSADMIIPSYDRSASRLQLLRTQAERAVKLAPDSTEAQLAYASYLTTASFLTPDRERIAGEALSLVRKLNLAPAQQSRGWRLEMYCLVNLGRLDEWIAIIGRENAPQGRDPRLLDRATGQCIFAGRYAEAENFNNRALAIRKTGRALMMDVLLKLIWRGDLDGAAAALADWPSWLTLEDRGAFQASQVWLWRREPQKAVALLAPVSRDFLNDSWYLGPKAVLVALAQEMAGNAQAARAAWEDTKRVTTRVTGEQLTDQRALAYKAIAMARLGETAEAETLYRQLDQTKSLRSEFWSSAAPSALLRFALGHGDEVVAKFDKELRANSVRTAAPSPQAALRLNPVFDPIRATPEFQKWMAAAPAPEEKKENSKSAGNDLSAVASAKAEKSLVVLPLENLSPDPENASFAEGMHAEIVSTLQLIPELRVVSRNAALAFKNSSAPIAEIAQKLGVANVISGSVRREKDKVRIQLELRRANDDVLLWALPKGDRDAGNALAIQTEIAEQVARALQTRDLKGGFSTLAQFMTKNPRAYDLFVKVRATVDRINAADRVPVVAQCKAILELDPNFMLAANLLSTSLSQLAGSAPNTKERLSFVAEAKRWADAASRMAPGGAGDGALSYYYTYVEQDGLRGLAFAENTIRALPNWAAGYNNAGHACVLLGRTQDAADFYRRARELDSDALVFAGNWTGALTQLRQRDRVWDIYSAEPALRDVFATFAFRQFVLDGKLPASLDNFSDATRLTWLWRMRRFDEAAAVCAAELGKVTVPGSRQLTLLCLQSDLFHRLGRRVDAEQAAREALAVAQKLQSDSEVGPTQKPGWLASALERNGRADEAIAAALRAVAVTSPESQLGLRWTREINLAGIYAYANRPRECIELLAKLLRVPSGLTVPMVKVDPMWDNVREDAGFKALLADPKNSAPL